MDQWFVSWCVYTTSEAGGFNVAFHGSEIADYPTLADAGQVLEDIKKRLSMIHAPNYVHIVALNRV
ncbi:hypothetical protein ACMSZQ_002869 [Cronobacter dublinensis]